MTQENLKAARVKIEAVLREHDLAGFVSLHGPDWGEVFWNIWPSYSILKGDFPAIRLVSKAADYPGPVQQLHDVTQTAQMMEHLASTLRGCAPQFVELSRILDEKLNVVSHVSKHVPDPKNGVH